MYFNGTTVQLRLTNLSEVGDYRYLASFLLGDANFERTAPAFERLVTICNIIRDVKSVLVDASTRESILEGVCEDLTDRFLYEFAWVDDTVIDGESTPEKWADIDEVTVKRIARSDTEKEVGFVDCVVLPRR